MSVALHEDGRVLVIKLTGKLGKEDYEHLIPEVERLTKQHGKLRMLIEMHDFQGWTASALLLHLRDAERIGLVGHTSCEQGMAVFCKPFTNAPIRYFDRGEAGQAETWIHTNVLFAQ